MFYFYSPCQSYDREDARAALLHFNDPYYGGFEKDAIQGLINAQNRGLPVWLWNIA